MIPVDSLDEIGQLKQAIDTNELARVKNLMTRTPELHQAPLGYFKNGPLTWVAEGRVPWGPPSPARSAMAKWMIENGSDVHQGGVADLRFPPGNRLEALAGALARRYSIRVNDQYRIAFRFESGHAWEVRCED